MTREGRPGFQRCILGTREVTNTPNRMPNSIFMDDKSNADIAPAALFKDSNPLDPLTNNYNVNCNNPLMSAQQQSILCTPADAHVRAAIADRPSRVLL